MPRRILLELSHKEKATRRKTKGLRTMVSFAQLDAMAATLEPVKYVVMSKDGETPRFFEVAKVKGSNRLYELKGNPGDYTRHTCTTKIQHYVLWVLTSDPIQGIQLYDKHSRFCGVCDSALTHKRSLDCGVGPKCAKKHGVKW
jgi:hypothetical protein